MWTWVSSHGADLVVAAVLALLFAIIVAVAFEALSVGSRIRDGIRQIQNRYAERSIKKLEARIEEQKVYRTSIASDAGRVLVLFRMGFLTALSFGSAFMVDFIDGTRFAGEWDPLSLFSFLFLGLGVLICFLSIRITRIDAQPKLASMLAKLDREIADMSGRLEKLRKPDTPM